MDAIIQDLFEQLGRAARLSDACGVVLERAAERTGTPAAVAVIRAGRTVEAVGAGLADHRVRAVADACREDGSALDAALELDEPRVFTGPGPFPALDLDAYAVIPFDLSAGDAAGIVIVETDRLDERTEFFALTFRRCGAALGRCLELEGLRERVGKLGRQRDLLTGIVNALSDPVLLTDPANDILLANDRAEHLFSTATADSEGRRRAVQINNLLFSSFLTQATMSRRGGPSRELTLVEPSDGSDLVFEVLSAPLTEAVAVAEGGILSILRDITDLTAAVTELGTEFSRSRAAEHRARQEWQRLNAILENVGGPILVTDDKSNILQMNREAERLFDVPVSFGPASPRRRLVRANDTRFTGLISDFVLQSGRRRVERIELNDPDTARPFPVEVVSSKLLNERGEPTAIVSTLHDLTQATENERLATELKLLNDELEDRIRRATEELEERNRQLEWQSEELEKASRLKSEFLASMSHELRTPINALLGYAAILREGIYGDLTEQQETALAKISMAAQHLLALINDVLDLSKIEAGQMLLTLEDVRLEELVDEVTETVAPLVRERSLEFDVDLGLPLPVLRTDATKVRQILLNLLSNAIKFTADGRVALRGEPVDGGGGVRIQVEDTGIGIQPDELETIFDDFRQADQSATREYGGTGLGLSITKKLLSLLGGTISVESEYGEGSCFTVELPLETDPGTRDDQLRRAIVDADRAVVKG